MYSWINNLKKYFKKHEISEYTDLLNLIDEFLDTNTPTKNGYIIFADWENDPKNDALARSINDYLYLFFNDPAYRSEKIRLIKFFDDQGFKITNWENYKNIFMIKEIQKYYDR